MNPSLDETDWLDVDTVPKKVFRTKLPNPKSLVSRMSKATWFDVALFASGSENIFYYNSTVKNRIGNTNR